TLPSWGKVKSAGRRISFHGGRQHLRPFWEYQALLLPYLLRGDAVLEMSPGQRWEQKSELQSRRVVVHLDASAVEASDGCDQTETQPIAGRPATAFQSVKALENLLTLAGRDSRPVTGDRND